MWGCNVLKLGEKKNKKKKKKRWQEGRGGFFFLKRKKGGKNVVFCIKSLHLKNFCVIHKRTTKEKGEK